MITSYNVKGVGDTLIIILSNSEGKEVEAIRKGDVACVTLKETGDIVGWNIFSASHKITNLVGDGQVQLSPSQITELNLAVKEAGFDAEFTADNSPKFVVGFVKECEKHQDSDHLNITKIIVDNEEELQIVCGAPNIAQGMKVVVAKVGAMMPDGMLIWPGELRGVKSDGMVCSARELGLENAPAKKGILELPETAKVGKAFNFNITINE
ncbi:YtpR family tRNA-binding protein [Vagococcus hydrophili]|uniref:DUF4479 and tRNA-binding domain-containing protein n=1 Tax=Vagococcus hydrophili TaxID=2714947 RepID=A0A6G8ATK3_9ENTE|nr:DUF4479 and tRNA-binding domain-containing protein [Vagococcus hydrophili]QIL48408.1 DUF4479 and tRNA-binding domain-containing protein [Vagococcus hydrophili]